MDRNNSSEDCSIALESGSLHGCIMGQPNVDFVGFCIVGLVIGATSGGLYKLHVRCNASQYNAFDADGQSWDADIVGGWKQMGV